jgi:RimJ/RimL family protein N-acetyltransferase
MTIAVWLRGERIGFRAPVLADAAFAIQWAGGPFPLTADRAEELLRRSETDAWGGGPMNRLMTMDLTTNEIVGSVVIERKGSRNTELTFHWAPSLAPADRDVFVSEAMALLVPWLFGELQALTLRVEIPDDDEVMKGAASAAGLRETVRLPEFVARPGGRVDLLWYMALNPREATTIAQAPGGHDA